MEGTSYDSRFQDSYGWGEGPVESAQEVFRRNGGLQAETCHLGEGMDTGVGAPGALGQGRFAGDPAQGVLQLALNGGFIGLNLPAPEICAIVGQGELPGLRVRFGFGGIGHWYQGTRPRRQPER